MQEIIRSLADSISPVEIGLVCQKNVSPHFRNDRRLREIFDYPDGVGFDKSYLDKQVADQIVANRYDAVVTPMNVEDGLNYEKVRQFADWVCDLNYEITPSWKILERRALRRLKTMPRQYIIAASSRCDVACILCASGDRRTRFGSDMPYNIFEGILSSLNNKHAFFGLLLGGEPFLNPDLVKIGRDIKKRNRFLSITTHANLIDKQLADHIVDMGVDELRISVHAGQKRLYEKVMRGASWDRLLSALKALNNAKEKAGAKLPKIYFIMTGMKLNIHQLPAVVRLAKEYGVSKVIINTFMPNARVTGQSLMEDIPLLRRYYDEARELGDDCGVVVTLDEADNYRQAIFNDRPEERHAARREEAGAGDANRNDSPTKMCLDPWINVHLYETGVVLPCCGGVKTPFGNLDQDELVTIWNNELFIALRDEILSGRLRDECRNCQLKAGGRVGDLWRQLVDLGIESQDETFAA